VHPQIDVVAPPKNLAVEKTLCCLDAVIRDGRSLLLLLSAATAMAASTEASDAAQYLLASQPQPQAKQSNTTTNYSSTY